MKTSSAGRSLIEHSEGLALKAYRCPAGVLTIGYGHTSEAGGPEVHVGMTITPQEADAMLASDLSRFEGHLTASVKVPLDGHQFDALVSFIYNVGPGNFIKSTLLRKLNRKDFAAIPSELLKWNKAGGRTLPGLTARRHAEAAMWDGMAVALPHAGPVPQKIDVPKSKPSLREPTTPPLPSIPTQQKAPSIPAFIAAFLAFFGIATAAHAADVSVTPFATDAINLIIYPVLAGIPAWAGIVLTKGLARFLDQKTAALLGDNFSAALNWAISKGVQEAAAWVDREDFHVQVDSWVASIAVNYAQSHFPALAKKAGGDLAEKVQARLATHTDLLALKAKAASA